MCVSACTLEYSDPQKSKRVALDLLEGGGGTMEVFLPPLSFSLSLPCSPPPPSGRFLAMNPVVFPHGSTMNS